MEKRRYPRTNLNVSVSCHPSSVGLHSGEQWITKEGSAIYDPVDQLLENIFKYFLHKRRKKYIRDYVAEYSETNSNPTALKNLTKLLTDEIDRIFAIVDRSILRDRIKRAKITFWFTAIISVGIALALIFSGITAGGFVPFLIPICSVVVAWLMSVGTIHISYNERVMGGMDSVAQAFTKSLLSNLDIDINKEFTEEDYYRFKKILRDKIKDLEGLDKLLDYIHKSKQSDLPSTLLIQQPDNNESFKTKLKLSKAPSESEVSMIKKEKSKQKDILRKFSVWKKHSSPEQQSHENVNDFRIKLDL